MLVLREGTEVENELAHRRVACPRCREPVGRFGWARTRVVRTLDGERLLRPRRAWCGRCRAGHVIFPAWAVPRRRDAAEVIVAALVAKATGAGHRRIAEALCRPPATVRGWLRRASAQAETIRVAATTFAHALDPCLGAINPTGSALGDAVEALGVAASAAGRRLGPRAASEVAVAITGGLLVPTG